MTVSRALLFATFMVAAPFAAYGQFGGMPGMPGAPGGMPGGGGFGGPQQGPPPACRELLAMRDEVQKHGTAIQKANERKATVQEACKLFKTFLASEAKMIKSVEENLTVCGVPSEVPKQMKGGHAHAEQIAKQVCEAAAMGPRPTGPSLSDALGTSPTVPDANAKKRGNDTFDTLTGNALSR